MIGDRQVVRDTAVRSPWITSARDELGKTLLVYAAMVDNVSAAR